MADRIAPPTLTGCKRSVQEEKNYQQRLRKRLNMAADWSTWFYATLGFLTIGLMHVNCSDLGTTYHYFSPGNFADIGHVTMYPGETLPLIGQVDTVDMPNATGVKITWESSSTSSISISWSWVFISGYPTSYPSYHDTPEKPQNTMANSRQKHLKRKFVSDLLVEGWNVGYHVRSGSFLSKMLPPETNTYTLSELQSNTPYNVCVNAHPLHVSSWPATQPRSYCRLLRTIPLIRRDSIVGLILVFGYYALMIGLGVIQWRRRVFLSQRWKRHSIEEHSEDVQEAAVRWRDLDDTDNETSRLKSADN